MISYIGCTYPVKTETGERYAWFVVAFNERTQLITGHLTGASRSSSVPPTALSFLKACRQARRDYEATLGYVLATRKIGVPA